MVIRYNIGYKILTIDEILEYLTPVIHELGELSFSGEKLINYIAKIHNYARFIVAYHEKEIAGLFAFYDNNQVNKEGYFTMLHVRKEYRIKGIAKDFFNMCIEHLKNLGYTVLKGEVNKKNYVAIDSYLKLGFTVLLEKESTYIVSKKL